MRVAHPCRRRAGDRVGGTLVDERGEQRRQQVDLDALAAAAAVAMAERSEDADRREEAGEDVDERDTDLLRLAAGVAGDAHQPAEGLDEQVVAGQRRPGAARRSR